jgi:hypothetical protein
VILRFRTINGTVYELNRPEMTWKRISRTHSSGITRKDFGRLINWPDIKIGHPAMLFDTDVKVGFTHHMVYTSEVVATEYLNDEED